MANGYATEMTFVKTANNGNQLVFVADNGHRYKMSFTHFLENMSPKNKVIYTKAGGLPIVGQSYSVYLYPDTGHIALDRSVYLWERRERDYSSYSYSGGGYRGRKHRSKDIGEVSVDFGCALYNLFREIWHGLKSK